MHLLKERNYLVLKSKLLGMSYQVKNYLILRRIGFALLNIIILPYKEDSIYFSQNPYHLVNCPLFLLTGKNSFLK